MAPRLTPWEQSMANLKSNFAGSGSGLASAGNFVYDKLNTAINPLGAIADYTMDPSVQHAGTQPAVHGGNDGDVVAGPPVSQPGFNDTWFEDLEEMADIPEATPVYEADDFDGSVDEPFTEEDIVNAVAPTKGGKKTKTPKKQIKKRANVRKAVRQAKVADAVANPYSKNPFAKNFSPSAFVDGAGSRGADERHIPGARAYEAARDVRVGDANKPGGRGAFGMNPDDKIMGLF